jgi:hypothetical protein
MTRARLTRHHHDRAYRNAAGVAKALDLPLQAIETALIHHYIEGFTEPGRTGQHVLFIYTDQIRKLAEATGRPIPDHMAHALRRGGYLTP